MARHGRRALGLLISWSAGSEELARRVRSLLTELVPEHVALEQPHAHSQFEHYRELAAFVATQTCHRASRRDVWVGFSDDDDLWHPRRLETFYAGLADAHGRPSSAGATVTQLSFPWYAARHDDDARRGGGGRAEQVAVHSTAEVDAMLRRCEASVTRLSSESEHWTAVSRFDLLDGFFRAAPPYLVASPFADLAWERFSAVHSDDGRGRSVIEGGESVVVPWTCDACWMYYYNMPACDNMKAHTQRLHHTAGGSSVHASSAHFAPTPEEWSTAQRMVASWPISRAKASEAEARAAHHMAHLRRNLSVTCASKLWTLRWRASAQQMLEMLSRDLERTWRAHPPDMQDEIAVQDCKMLDASRPLRELVHGLDLPIALVDLFEARCARVAATATVVPADECG